MVTSPIEQLRPAGTGGGSGGHGSWGEGGGGGGEGGGSSPSGMPQLGMALALVSITALFAALAAAYLLRMKSDYAGPRAHIPPYLWISTVVLLASSVTLEQARHALWHARLPRYRRLLHLTFGLGLAFVASQLLTWLDLVRQGVVLEANPHGSVYFVFTGAHGLHVLGGLIYFAYLVLRARKLGTAEAALRRARTLLATSALYWHCMGLLWLGLFGLLLLWR